MASFQLPASTHWLGPRAANAATFVTGRATGLPGGTADLGSEAGSCGTDRPECALSCTGQGLEAGSNARESRLPAWESSARISAGVMTLSIMLKNATLPPKWDHAGPGLGLGPHPMKGGGFQKTVGPDAASIQIGRAHVRTPV